jgi:hypothetical protein
MKAIQSAIEITNVLFLEQIRLCGVFWPPSSRIKPASQKTDSGFQKLIFWLRLWADFLALHK